MASPSAIFFFKFILFLIPKTLQVCARVFTRESTSSFDNIIWTEIKTKSS